MKCLMLEFEEVKPGEFRATHPFWRDGVDFMDIVVKRDSSKVTWGIFFEDGVVEDDIRSAEAAMWAAAAHVVHEVAEVASCQRHREEWNYSEGEEIAAEHLLAKWQAAFETLEQKAGV